MKNQADTALESLLRGQADGVRFFDAGTTVRPARGKVDDVRLGNWRGNRRTRGEMAAYPGSPRSQGAGRRALAS